MFPQQRRARQRRVRPSGRAGAGRRIRGAAVAMVGMGNTALDHRQASFQSLVSHPYVRFLRVVVFTRGVTFTGLVFLGRGAFRSSASRRSDHRRSLGAFGKRHGGSMP